MTEWTPIRDLPATRLYFDQWGNVRRRSTETGRFVTGRLTPGYGQTGYGTVIRLSAERVTHD